jgi:hypothetical protein
MAHYQAAVDTLLPAQAFSYLSDFTTAAEWDPGAVQSQRLGEGPIGEGTEFRLVAAFLGRETAPTYRIVEYQPPHAVTFRGELDRRLTRPDHLRSSRRRDANRLRRRLTLRGPLKLANLLLALAFNRVGDHAVAGLRDTIGTQQTDADTRTALTPHAIRR